MPFEKIRFIAEMDGKAIGLDLPYKSTVAHPIAADFK